MDMRAILAASPVVPVVTLERVEDGVPLAEALLAGGLRSIEVTLRTDTGIEAIRQIVNVVPQMIVGAGTVLRRDDLLRAQDAGAHFAVSPGATSALLEAADEVGLPFLPGAVSPSEVMLAFENGFDCLKFFPASVQGTAALKALAGPFPGVGFCTTGGITQENARQFLACANVCAIGVSWVGQPDLLANRDWKAIEERAREARMLSPTA